MDWEKEIELIGDIEKELYLYLKPYKDTYIDENFNFNISQGLTPIEIRYTHVKELEARSVEETHKNELEMKRGLMLEIDIDSENKQLHISNVYIPKFMKSEGVDKKIISIIFNLVDKYGYELFVMDMGSKFYKNLNESDELAYNESDDTLYIREDSDLDK